MPSVRAAGVPPGRIANSCRNTSAPPAISAAGCSGSSERRTRASAYLVRQGNWKLIYNADAPHQLFNLESDPNELTNKLVIRLQPEETITLHTLNKMPGLAKSLRLKPVELHLTDDSQEKSVSHDAYERLLLDAILGDQTLFMRRDEVEAAWRWTDSIIEGWQETNMEIKSYNAGTQGPGAATALLAIDGRNWYE